MDSWLRLKRSSGFVAPTFRFPFSGQSEGLCATVPLLRFIRSFYKHLIKEVGLYFAKINPMLLAKAKSFVFKTYSHALWAKENISKYSPFWAHEY